MRKHWLIALTAVALFAAAASGQSVPELKSYTLPEKAAESLAGLAAQSDVLILGETHGTQEVPAVAAALLAPLSKLGYGVLALEIPSDQQQPLIDWATGQTTTVPVFFRKPAEEEDGRANVQLLALIRTALSPPYEWKLSCIDTSEAEAKREYEEFLAREKAAKAESQDFMVTIGNRRDAGMAHKLAADRQQLAPGAKVLTICGSFHARTSKDCRLDNPDRIPPDHPISKFWPSFAAALQSDNPEWHVRSINVVAHSGDYFAMLHTDNDQSEPKPMIHQIRSKERFAEAEARPLENEYWNWVLHLPRATAATFLAIPNPPQAPQPKSSKGQAVKDAALRRELLDRVKRDQDARNAWIQWTKEHGEKIIGTVKLADFTDEQKAEYEQLHTVTKIDEENTAWLKQLIERRGWPTASLVGKDGAHAAWLLVQHADRDPNFQRQCLDLIIVLPKDEVSQKDIAYLTDRVLLKEGKQQIYGTQFTSEEGKWKPQPLEDEANVDARRAEVGLPPLSEYVKQLESAYGSPPPKK